MKIGLTIAHILITIVLMAVVLFQQGKDAGMGSITGGSSDTFYGKNRPKTYDSMLERLTTAFAILFIVTSLLLSIFFG